MIYTGLSLKSQPRNNGSNKKKRGKEMIRITGNSSTILTKTATCQHISFGMSTKTNKSTGYLIKFRRKK